MTYLDYLAPFHELDQVQAFSGNATRLYLKLLAFANAVGWPQEFTKADAEVAAACGCSLTTLRASCAQLASRGLLTYTSGNGRTPAAYHLAAPDEIRQQLVQPGKRAEGFALAPEGLLTSRALKEEGAAHE